MKHDQNGVYYEEYQIDIQTFKLSHPGGAFMLNDVQGEDIGKYLIGCSSINNDLNPYSHSKLAYEILNTLKIGKICYPDKYLITNDHENNNDMN